MIDKLRPKVSKVNKSKSKKTHNPEIQESKYIELDSLNEVIVQHEKLDNNIVYYSSDTIDSDYEKNDNMLSLFDLRFFCGEYLELNKEYLCKDILLNIKEQNDKNHYQSLKEYLSTKYSPYEVNFTIEYSGYHRVKDVIHIDDTFAYIPVYIENIAWNLLKHVKLDRQIKIVDYKIYNKPLYKRDELVFDFNNKFCELCKVQNICTKIL